MSSIKEAVFTYLENNPKAGNRDLYKNFPDYNRGSIRVYRNEYLQTFNQNITFNITQYKKEAEKDADLSFKEIECILYSFDLFPAFIFVKLYNETFIFEKKGINEYSVVDLCEKLFLQIISGKYDINEFLDFYWDVDKELERIYIDAKENSKTPKNIDIKRLYIKKKWDSLKLVSDLNSEIEPFRKFRTSETTKNIDKKKIVKEITDYMFARILNSYVFFDLYSISNHLRNRDCKYVWRDLNKLNLKYFQGSEINNKCVINNIYNNRYFFSPNQLFCDLAKIYDEDFKLKIPTHLDMKNDFYKEIVSKDEMNPTKEILKEKENKQIELIVENVKHLIEKNPDLFTTNETENLKLLKNKINFNFKEIDLGIESDIEDLFNNSLTSRIIAKEHDKKKIDEISIEIKALEKELVDKLENLYNEQKRFYNNFESFENSERVQSIKEEYNEQIHDLKNELELLKNDSSLID